MLRFLTIGAIVVTQALGSAQTVRTGRLMREKLLHSQRVLAALTTSDYALLQRETKALSTVTSNPEWTELVRGRLQPYTADFLKALDGLSSAAERRDYDAAASSYTTLVSACLACHKHVMNSRIAGLR